MPIDEILIAMVFIYLLSGSNRPYYGVDNGLKTQEKNTRSTVLNPRRAKELVH